MTQRNGSKPPRSASRLWTAAFTAAAVWLLWHSGVNFLLLVAGETRSAVAEYSVPSWGARNRTYDTHYVLFLDGGEYRGSGPTARAVAAGSRVPVRVLPFAPSINAAGSRGALFFWAAASLLPGLGLAILAGRRFVRK